MGPTFNYFLKKERKEKVAVDPKPISTSLIPSSHSTWPHHQHSDSFKSLIFEFPHQLPQAVCWGIAEWQHSNFFLVILSIIKKLADQDSSQYY